MGLLLTDPFKWMTMLWIDYQRVLTPAIDVFMSPLAVFSLNLRWTH